MIPTDELIFFRGGETTNQNMVGITTVHLGNQINIINQPVFEGKTLRGTSP